MLFFVVLFDTRFSLCHSHLMQSSVLKYSPVFTTPEKLPTKGPNMKTLLFLNHLLGYECRRRLYDSDSVTVLSFIKLKGR